MHTHTHVEGLTCIVTYVEYFIGIIGNGNHEASRIGEYPQYSCCPVFWYHTDYHMESCSYRLGE